MRNQFCHKFLYAEVVQIWNHLEVINFGGLCLQCLVHESTSWNSAVERQWILDFSVVGAAATAGRRISAHGELSKIPQRDEQCDHQHPAVDYNWNQIHLLPSKHRRQDYGHAELLFTAFSEYSVAANEMLASVLRSQMKLNDKRTAVSRLL